MIVTIRDSETGKTHHVSSDMDEYWWSEGNGACDCNRASLVGVTDEVPCGQSRFAIVGCDTVPELVEVLE